MYEGGLSKIQMNYCLAKRDQRKFIKDIKVIPSEERIIQH